MIFPPESPTGRQREGDLEVIHYYHENVALKDLAEDGKERDGVIIRWIGELLTLGIGTTNDFFHIGITPDQPALSFYSFGWFL